LKKIRLGSTSEAGSTLHESARLRGSASQAAVRTAKTYCCADSERVPDIHGPSHCKDLRMVIYLLRVFYFLLARDCAAAFNCPLALHTHKTFATLRIYYPLTTPPALSLLPVLDEKIRLGSTSAARSTLRVFYFLLARQCGSGQCGSGSARQRGSVQQAAMPPCFA
jgi:hypothetical protein